MRWLLGLVFVFCAWSAAGQTWSGVVIDSADQAPLPFVHILVDGDPQKGEVTDLDGTFSIPPMENATYLEFRYVGYRTVRVPVERFSARRVIALVKTGIQLAEVEVKAGENPAHRIIQRVIDNRKLNNPLSYDNFSYQAYDKLIVTSNNYLKEELLVASDSTWFQVPDSLQSQVDSISTDTSGLSFLDSNYLFILETVSQRDFQGPSKDVTEIMGTQASGLRIPELFLQATDFQPFSFYEDRIELLGTSYVNPIAKGAINRYFYDLQDTLYDGPDSIYVIAYRPRKGKTFQGLQGALYIHTDGYAVQHLLAEPVGTFGMKMHIQQTYQRVNGQWFPDQLHTDLAFPFIWIEDGPAVATARSYLSKVTVNKEQVEKKNTRFAVRVLPKAEKKDSDWWAQYRRDTLTPKEQQTYVVLDSLSEEVGAERKIRWLLALARGSVRSGPIDWPIKDWVAFNNYEGVRLGLGGETNELFSDRIVLKGNVAYGTRDKAWKYGASVAAQFWPGADAWLRVGYRDEVFESGRQRIQVEPADELWLHNIRKYLVSDMFTERAFSLEMPFRPLPSLTVEPFIRSGSWQSPFQYQLAWLESDNITVWQRDFFFTEVGARLKWVPGQSLARIRSRVIPMNSNKPAFWLSYRQGIPELYGELTYQAVEGQFQYRHTWRNNTATGLDINAGWIEGRVPYYQQFLARGSRFTNAYYVIENNFHTMPIHTYLADRYATAFVRHEFGHLFKGKGFFQPRWVLILGGYWGDIKHPEYHRNNTFAVAPKGYYEGGLIIHDIYSTTDNLGLNTGLGIGAFYHFGPYATGNWQDNLAFRVAIRFGIGE